MRRTRLGARMAAATVGVIAAGLEPSASKIVKPARAGAAIAARTSERIAARGANRRPG